MKRSLLSLLALLLVGCSEGDPETAVIIRLDAEGMLRRGITEVRLRVSGGPRGGTFGDPVLDERVVTNADRWPLTTVVAPIGGEMDRAFRYEANGFGAEGDELGHIRVVASFVDGERETLELLFPEGCAELDCGDLSCEAVGGAPRCIPPERDLRPGADGGMDGGSDGGSDGGMDGGSDAGPPDGGHLTPPVLRWPPNGHYTGSVHAPASLRPLLRWEALDGVTEYAVQMVRCADDEDLGSCAERFTAPDLDERAPATAGAPVRWQPTTSLAVETATTPFGARYLWRVAGCAEEGCGPPSVARYLNVGRLRGDLNGDGYGDLAAGDVDHADVTFVGTVSRFDGAATLGPGLVAEALISEASSPDFGMALATGDFDGDGYADLAVGAGGRTEVYWGLADGLPASTLLKPPESLSTFGTALASLGDIDGDGCDDLAIGRTAANQVFVVRGAGDRGLTIPEPFPASGVDAVRPAAIPFAAGDVDGNGFPDLLIGLPDPAPLADGFALLFRSEGPDGFGTETRLATGETTANLDRFGEVAVHGDFDGDGFDDLAIGAPSFGLSGEGRVYVMRGGRVRLDDVWVALEGDGFVGEQFGAGLAAGDIDRDGKADLVVGAPFWGELGETRIGRVRTYYGGEGGDLLVEGATAPLDGPDPTQSEAYGRRLALTDLDGDGDLELLIGAPLGQFIHLLQGPSDTTPIRLAPALVGASEPNEFPSSLAP